MDQIFLGVRSENSGQQRKEIWTRSEPEYHGDLVNFDPMMAWPKPVQKPHPPVLVGCAFPYSTRSDFCYGNGRMPSAPSGKTDLLDEIPRFRQMVTEAGRDPASLSITSWYPLRNLDLMKRYRDLGIERVVFSVPSDPADKVLPHLDDIDALMASATP